ncbi:MAG: ATP phosphoribosyltransferase regulatory subunit [Ruminococcus sp.]|nr:ATP phosphoribosyltransferase regulatory subunit [Ruminococcus sp.]
MKKNDLITPEGTRDLLFNDCLARRAVEQRLAELFGHFGYSEVVTPGIEFYDLFSGSSRHFRQERMYKLTDSKGRLIVIRPDSTIPIARLASTRLASAVLPLRLYYNQAVYENNALLKGRSDEIVQSGIELIGGEDRERADYEAMCLALEALGSFGADDFRFELGDIGYFKELVARLEADESTREEIRLLISAKNYPALNDLLDQVGQSPVASALKALPRLFGGIEVFDKASELFTDDKIDAILRHLKEVYLKLCELGYGGKISVDLGIVSHADYYTGIVFKGYLSGVGQSVLKGGRYDGLMGEFGRPCPAVGFGVNCDEVAAYLRKNGLAPSITDPGCVIYAEAGHSAEAVAFARSIVAKGEKAEIGLHSTLEATKEYAAKRGINTIYVIGDTTEKIEL